MKKLYDFTLNKKYESLSLLKRKQLYFQRFNNDLEAFQKRIADVDRRLGSIAAQAFDDCPSTESAFKLINIFGGLLER